MQAYTEHEVRSSAMEGLRLQLCTDLYLRSQGFYVVLLQGYRKFLASTSLAFKSTFDTVSGWFTEGLSSSLHGLFGAEEMRH